MFSSFTIILAVAGLATLSAGGVAYALLQRRIESENRVTQRLERIQSSSPTVDVSRGRANDAARRRKAVQETLKEIEEKQKATRGSASPSLALRIEQAGLDWSRRTFWMLSAGIGLVVFVLSWFLGAPIYAALGLFIAGFLGLPRWIINFLRKRRINGFVTEFANALDVIVRGVKAGLPLNDCIRIIANEAAEPVKSEFRKLSEAQSMGLPLGDAVAKLPERVPVAEANFFAIVIAIQQKSGGNLAETLANLSRVLRERSKMKGKIKAMSMEAKASAAIIGSLPPVVMVLVYLTSPGYISLLFTDPFGNLILGFSAVWMTAGVLVIRKMVNFDF